MAKCESNQRVGDYEKAFSNAQVLEVRNADGRLHVARKAKHPDEWDPPVEPYDPYGPGNQRALSDYDVIIDEPETDASAAETDASAAEA